MTYEEVKRIRNNMTLQDIDNDELSRMIDIAIEKQIPKKTIVKYPQQKDWMFCSCGEYLCNIGQEIKPKFCEYCGQALDFTEE